MHMEKILTKKAITAIFKKHLHAHGENLICLAVVLENLETPPCTWRKSQIYTDMLRFLGNTSMHMEKIPHYHAIIFGFEKHLHAHGENSAAVP